MFFKNNLTTTIDIEGPQVTNKINSKNSLWWWEPNQESTLWQYFASSSLNGLKYVSEPKRHISERIFWAISFVICFTGAVLMIKEIWQKYYANPVIVTFSTTDEDILSIPFPAVTFCNTSPFKKSSVEKYVKQYKESKVAEERSEALDALRAFNAVCRTQKSFLKTMNYAKKRGEIFGIPEANESPSIQLERNMTQFIMRNSQRCGKLIRLCTWGQKAIPCRRLFMPIITDYGMCCTFNYMPQRSIGKYLSPTSDTYTLLTNRWWWSDEDVAEWDKWDYNNDGYIIRKELKYPWRQIKAGRLGGLSVLLDPDIVNSFCPTLDSLGVKVLYHVALDPPRASEYGQLVEIGKEMFMKVIPDLTIADKGIKSIPHDTRKCYFGREFSLSYYRPYTRDNCIEECFNNKLLGSCGCVLYYMPRNSTTSVCNTNHHSDNYKCVENAQKEFDGRAHIECSYCKFSCNDLTYNTEISHSTLQPSDLLKKFDTNNNSHTFTIHDQISIVHIFFGADSTVPKLRQKLFQTVDLIANTGGLLGLLIGFSVLGMIEIFYFATIRLCCGRIRRSERFGPMTNMQIPEEENAGENKLFFRRANNDSLFNPVLTGSKY